MYVNNHKLRVLDREIWRNVDGGRHSIYSRNFISPQNSGSNYYATKRSLCSLIYIYKIMSYI